eukprot:Gb_04190 [translate_table: standard]
MACVAECPLQYFDERSRKRRRLTSSWNVPLCQDKAQSTVIYSGADFGKGPGNEFPPLKGEHSELNCSSSLNSKRVTARNASPPWRDDDKHGHYMFALGENLTSRYKILSKMGKGTFGQVLECWDRKLKEFVAIKIVRSSEQYREAAMIEIDVLRKVAEHDRSARRCVQMRNWFDYRNHTCIVFEKLGPSLYDFLRKNNYCPFPIHLVREIGWQLLESVAYMHDLHLIHTDLKPENILFVSSDYMKLPDNKSGSKRSLEDRTYIIRLPKSSEIKLIDFGSTTFEDQDHSSVISTRHYRAPEVILGLGWNCPCDIWSVGCILVELCSGETLFQTHENLEHLAMMERVLGPLPRHMIMKADRQSAKYFRHRRRLDWPEGAGSRESIKAVKKLPQLRNLVMRHVDHSASALIDLLEGLLRFDPSERLEARQALNHPFFDEYNGRHGSLL